MRPAGAWPVSSALSAEGLRLCARPALALGRAGREAGALADPGPGQGSAEFCPPARDLGLQQPCAFLGDGTEGSLRRKQQCNPRPP